MNILQVSTVDQGGGAAKVAWDLFQKYRLRGHSSMLAVGYLRGAYRQPDPDIFEIPHDRYRGPAARLAYFLPKIFQRRKWRGETRIRNLLTGLVEPKRKRIIRKGFEDFDFPATQHIMEAAPVVPEILHCHNLHGDYFDLRALPGLSRRIPTLLTLHDMWTFTGHCAYSFHCTRWESGCGKCPSLQTYPAIQADNSAQNL